MVYQRYGHGVNLPPVCETPAAMASDVGPLIRDGRPAGERVEEHLRELIVRGNFDRHARLPPERELAEHLGVSRMTLRQALAALERDGLVTRSAGRNGGTFLARGTVERNLGRFTGVPAYLASQGYTAGCPRRSARHPAPHAPAPGNPPGARGRAGCGHPPPGVGRRGP